MKLARDEFDFEPLRNRWLILITKWISDRENESSEDSGIVWLILIFFISW